MIRFLLNLLNIDETHPGVRQMLEKGALSVRRSNVAFGRNPIDLTLEQTINADAASKLTGYQQSVAAKNRWTLTKSARTSIVSMLKAKCGMASSSEEKIHNELKASRVKRDSDDLKKLIEGIQQSCNPFTEELSATLYNIATGKAATPVVRDDMLKFRDNGNKWYDEFKSECFANEARFEQKITRKKVNNFASEAIKTKISAKDMKVHEVKGTRDLFGRLLYLATVMKLDMKKVFAYPLTPIPLCLGHVNGAMHSSAKAKLGNYIQGKVNSEKPAMFDT